MRHGRILAAAALACTLLGCTTYLLDSGAQQRLRATATLSQQAWIDTAPDSGVPVAVIRAETAEICRSARATLDKGGGDAGGLKCGGER